MTDEQMLAFCDRSRPSLATPWPEGGWRYATDGSICVRVPDPRGAVPDPAPHPNAARLFDSCGRFGRAGGVWRPWPANPVYVYAAAGAESSLCADVGAEIGKRIIQERYFLLIGGLSAVEWLDDDGARNAPVQFRFRTVAGEGQGLVMGMA
jgi:hypothetical protein